MEMHTVYVCSCLPAHVDKIWDMLQRLDTLQYIAAPYLTFQPAGNTTPIWIKGETVRFRLRLFGVIPLGIHSIIINRLDKDSYVIYSNEGNKLVPVWNHRIMLQKTDDYNISNYSDEVQIYAGWKTPIVALWCRLFYKHRQKKWLKLINAGHTIP